VEPLIELTDLARDYNGRQAVRGLSVVIPGGEDEADAAARRTPLVDAFDLGRDLDRPMGEYSKGMKQKILLIAALQHDPRVLLLDEPLDGLDVPAQEFLKELIR